MSTPAAQQLLETLRARIERNREAALSADDEDNSVRLVYRVWVDATQQALDDVEYLLPRIREEAVWAALEESSEEVGQRP
jgi:hypothetical protein